MYPTCYDTMQNLPGRAGGRWSWQKTQRPRHVIRIRRTLRAMENPASTSDHQRPLRIYIRLLNPTYWDFSLSTQY